MKVLDLFSGIGGFSLGLERAGFETVAFCEIEEYPQRVLKKHWPETPIYDDVRQLTYDRLKQDGIGTIDIICGGYPCQPFSVAGERRGKEDDRHLWPEYLRLIRECRPSWIIAENVPGHINLGLDDVLSDLEGENYSWSTFIIPALSLDAKHRRDRLWIVANASGRRCRQPQERKNKQQRGAKVICTSQTLANSNGAGLERGEETGNAKEIRSRVFEQLERRGKLDQWREWPTEPGVGRVVNGIPNRVDRIKGLGNAVVPQIPEIIGLAIKEIEKNETP